MADVAALVRQHLAAFNAHDTERVLAGLSEDAVWRTGSDTFRGRGQLLDVFDDWLWDLAPSLELRHLVAGDGTAAAELTERLTHDGAEQSFAIAVFFRFDGARIVEAVVYREGNADLARRTPVRRS